MSVLLKVKYSVQVQNLFLLLSVSWMEEEIFLKSYFLQQIVSEHILCAGGGEAQKWIGHVSHSESSQFYPICDMYNALIYVA